MADIKQLKEGDKVIYPLTSTKAIVDEEGKRVSIPTKTSELNNDSGYITEERVEEMIEDKVTSANVTNIVSITQADYDALETKDETTLYLITE